MAHRPEDVVGMEMRNDDSISTLAGSETRSLHVVGELATTVGAPLPPKPVSNSTVSAAAADRRGREGVGELVRAGAGGNQGLLDLVQRRVLDIAFDTTLGTAVVQAKTSISPTLYFRLSAAR